MNAIGLLLCTVIVSADVRETIPTSRQLYEIIARTASPVPHDFADWPRMVSADGAKIELFDPHNYAVLSKLAERQPSMIADLVVVPCPDRTDCVLAGYLLRHVDRSSGGALFTESCVLIDVSSDRLFAITSSDRDPSFLIINSDGNSVVRRGDLPTAERAICEPPLRAFASLLVKNVAEFPGQYGFEKNYNEFLGRFDDRAKIKVTCEVARIDMALGRATFYLLFSGGEKRERVTFTKPIIELLESKYAVPIEQYLKNK